MTWQRPSSTSRTGCPFPSDQAREIIEADLGGTVGDMFSEFERDPLASASVAQVHGARLHDGRAVIVKVIRPGIERVIRQDIRLLYLMAGLLERYWSEGRRLHPVEVVSDYEKTIFDELDMQREGANASQLRRNFPDSSLIYVPDVYWPYTSKRVVTMERVSGIPIGDTQALRDAGVDMKVLAEKGGNFLHPGLPGQLLPRGHAPGQYLRERQQPSRPPVHRPDFGIVGTLGPTDKNYLARNLLAFFERDYHQVAVLHVQSGWVPADTRIDEFEAAIRTVCEPIFARPLKDISFGHFLLRLFEVARRFEMEVQPQLVLLQKTLLNVEGLGRQLYPELDLWATAHPFLEDWMQKRIGPPGLLQSLRRQLPDLAEQAPEMPQLIHDALEHLARGQAPMQPRSTSQTDTTGNSTSGTFLLGGVVAVAGPVVIAEPAAHEWFRSLPPASWILLAVGGVLFWQWTTRNGHSKS